MNHNYPVSEFALPNNVSCYFSTICAATVEYVNDSVTTHFDYGSGHLNLTVAKTLAWSMTLEQKMSRSNGATTADLRNLTKRPRSR